jgi:hypothetical protein
MSHDANELSSLSERLRILRCVYGVSEKVRLSIIQLQHLWNLCSIPADREELMVFVASASTFSGTPSRLSRPQPQHPVIQAVPADGLTAAFSDEVRISAFVDLMCSETVDWDVLGERAYHSFQLMYKRLRQSPTSSTGPALNALWRICLTTGDECVAMIAMKDLLAVYTAMTTVNRTTSNAWSGGLPKSSVEEMQTDEDEILATGSSCLEQVKRGLDSGDVTSERSAERCLRILKAAVGQERQQRSILLTTSAIASLNSSSKDCSLADVVGTLASWNAWPIVLPSNRHYGEANICA